MPYLKLCSVFIISLKTQNNFCLIQILKVEPGMMMGTLTHQLLDKGWTIPVIPEFESLSVGSYLYFFLSFSYLIPYYLLRKCNEMKGLCQHISLY